MARVGGGMRYLSVCSGIEAATVAWHPLGWTAAAYSEIEKFPSQVLAHHYPDVPNVGDMTKFKEWAYVSNVDVLVGGTPCQSFSVAGLRKGLDDPRGNLMLTYLAIATKFRPKWLVWENVPGVLSSNGGLDFASLLRGMGECGYGFAYRILDAQYFGVAQRRRRVFVVGCLGDWRAAAAVLFERHSLSGYPAPSREKREETPSPTGMRLDVSLIGSLTAGFGKVGAPEVDAYTCIPAMTQPIPLNSMNCFRSPDADASTGCGIGYEGEAMFTISKAHSHAVAQPIAFSRNDDGRDATHDLAPTMRVAGNAGGMLAIAQPIAFGVSEKPDVGLCLRSSASKADKHESTTYVTQPIAFSGKMSYPQADVDITQTLGAQNPMAVAQPVSYSTKLHNTTSNNAGKIFKERTTCLDANSPPPALLTAMAVRRLTPVECERLQGFPDNYTNIKDKCPDGPRYKALGNSMAVPVMAWIGKRIQEVENIK